MNVENLLKYTEYLKSEIKSLEYNPDDVRHSFFGLYYTCIYEYYIGKITYEISRFIGTGDIKFSENIFSFKTHIGRLFEIKENNILSKGFHMSLNRNLIIGVWTSFELSINLIFENIIIDDEREKIVKRLNEKILKEIEGIENVNYDAIINHLKNTTFIPFLRQFNYLVKRKPNCYIGDLKEDRKFLEFVVKLRNCLVHSNGIYHGKDFYYKFGNEEFKFIDKEMFYQKGSNYKNVYFDIGIKINEIFKNIINCLKDINFIKYPEDDKNIA